MQRQQLFCLMIQNPISLIWDCLCRLKNEGIISAMDILVNCAKSDSARVISGIYASGNAVYTTATMKASIYNGKQNLVFYNTNGSRAQSEIQEAANATLQAAMAGTEYLLKIKG